MFGREIRLERFLEVLADPQRIQLLQVGMAFQEDDPLDQPIRVVHFLDRSAARLVGDLAEAPVLLQPVMQPILTDRRKPQTAALR